MMNIATMLSLPQEFDLVDIEQVSDTITLRVRSTECSACCPICGQPTIRRHSTYTRIVADLPCGEHRVRIHLRVSKFFCDNGACQRKIFVERLAPFVAPWARMTTRLNHFLQSIGLATCGKLGARLAERLEAPVSWMTIIRRIIATPPPPETMVPHVGIDDFAFRRGRHYGSLVVDLDHHHLLDLLYS